MKRRSSIFAILLVLALFFNTVSVFDVIATKKDNTVTIPVIISKTVDVTYEDNHGQSEASNPDVYSYNKHGLLKKEVRNNAYNKPVYTYSYKNDKLCEIKCGKTVSFDKEGNITYFDGLSYKYDKKDRFKEVSETSYTSGKTNVKKHTYFYNQKNRITKNLFLGEGMSYWTYYSYDDHNNVISARTEDSTGTYTNDWKYTYDANGRLVQKEHREPDYDSDIDGKTYYMDLKYKYHYKNIEVPKSVAKTVKRQQWGLINEDAFDLGDTVLHLGTANIIY